MDAIIKPFMKLLRSILFYLSKIMKSNKYTLLDKQEKREQISESGAGEYNTNKNERGVPYTRLEDDFQQKHLSGSYAAKQAPSNSQNLSQSSKTSNKPPQMKATTYEIKNAHNSVLHIGASGIMVQSRVPYIPPVLIDCPKCKAKQQIPGNALEFICYGCHENSKTEPKFGLFICGVCQNQVAYPYKTSQHIQCNICFTVNKVPIDYFNPKDKKSETILPKDLRQQEVIMNEHGMQPDLSTAKGQDEDIQEFR